jgi:DNA repair protein SbcC/Rad50
MIPIKLDLTNFLSYLEPATLDFQGIHLACISGPNGAGKSSILDALTWALFGRSRSKSDDDVVNRLAAARGESAEVRFTFQHESGVYRIIRRKGVGKTMLLEFQMAAGGLDDDADSLKITQSQQWKTLSEGRLRDTQEAIEHLLKMNYDTFVNASFLLQGKADEFTTKTPNKRKEILADLLGVNDWDVYKERAVERRKEVEGQLALLDGRLADIDAELDQEPERQAALAVAEDSLTRASEQLAMQEKLLEQLRRTEAAINQQKQLLKNLADNLVRSRARLSNLEASQQERQKERDAYQILLDESDQIEAGYQAWLATQTEAQGWQEKADAFNALQQEKRPHELAVEREKSRLLQRLTELAAREQQIANMTGERAEVEQALNLARQRMAAIESQIEALSARESEWHEARSQLRVMESERQLLRQELGQLQSQSQRIADQERERKTLTTNVEDASRRLESAAAELAAVDQAREQLMIARADADAGRAEQPRLKEEMERLKERLDQLADESGGTCPLCGQPLSESHRQSVLTDLKSEGQQKGDRYRENAARLQELVASINVLEPKVLQRDQLEREYHAQQQRLASAEARQTEIERAIADWQKTGAGRLQELQAHLAEDAAIQQQQKLVEQLALAAEQKKGLVEEQQAQQRQLSAAEARLVEIDRAGSEWQASGPAERAEIADRLEKNDIDPEAQAALAELDRQAAALAYDPDGHQAARQKLERLSEAHDRYQELQQARAAAVPLDKTLADLSGQIAEQAQQVEELAEQHQQAELELDSITADGGDLEQVEQEVFRLREDQINAHRRLATAQQNVSVLAQLRQQRQLQMEERAAISLLIQRLKVLEKACGREGVQALLIERALPEIEDDANELLERLTGGEMRVIFDTQRKLKSSDRLAETLDIRIADGVGERPYENYSGGEQFRVNFSIRLALSRILAKRAGARLQTLVIDEGFGSQDPSGRQRLIEAINTIQQDFARILVITHIDELRDAFPTRVEVEKNRGGSTITVI